MLSNARKRRKLHYKDSLLAASNDTPQKDVVVEDKSASETRKIRPSSSNSEMICCDVLFTSRNQLLAHKYLIHSRSASVMESTNSLQSSSALCSDGSNSSVMIADGLAPERDTAPMIAAALAKLESRSVNIIGAENATFPASNVPTTRMKDRADTTLEAKEVAPTVAAVVKERHKAGLEIICCKQCHVAIWDTSGAAFLSHILAHLFAIPKNLEHLRFCCKLCVKPYAMNVVRILHHSMMHPGASLSQILTHSRSGATLVFDYLDNLINALFGNAAPKVWSSIDPLSAKSSDSSPSVVHHSATTVIHYRCRQCNCFVSQDQLSSHVLSDFRVATVNEPMDNLGQQGCFQCRLCENSPPFVGTCSRRFALIHALQVHQGVPFANIFIWPPGGDEEWLLIDYLRGIVKRLFVIAAHALQVVDIIVNGQEEQPPRKSVKIEFHSVYKPFKPIPSHSDCEPIRNKIVALKSELSVVRHALNIMPKLPSHSHLITSVNTVKEEPVGNLSNRKLAHRSEMGIILDQDVKPDIFAR